MAELTIDPASIRKALDDFVSSYKPSDTPTQEVGYVATAGDGIAHVTGLPGCMANELLTFEDGTLGLAFNLDAREIGVVILGDFAGIEEGQEVRRTGEVLSVPVGDGYLGRVVDPLGKPLDGLGEIQGIEGRRILEAQAPDVMHRHPVDEPLSTGLKAIDAMTPIGRGQRQGLKLFVAQGRFVGRLFNDVGVLQRRGGDHPGNRFRRNDNLRFRDRFRLHGRRRLCRRFRQRNALLLDHLLRHLDDLIGKRLRLFFAVRRRFSFRLCYVLSNLFNRRLCGRLPVVR